MQVPLTYRVAAQSLHCPMVEITIGETRTKLIVDSGATEHILTIDLADRAGLTYEPGEPGTDTAGESVPSWRAGVVSASLRETSVDFSNVVVIEGPPPFAGWGVGGFLSPQCLWPEATVVFDMIGGELLVLEGPTDAVDDDLRLRYDGCVRVDAVRQSAGTLAVLASMQPFEPVVALLDSGAATTEFGSQAVPGLAGSVADGGRGVSGVSVSVTEVPDQVVAVGEAQRRLTSVFIRPSIPTPDGAKPDEVPHALLGMDCMRGTALVIGPRSDGSVRWFVGPAQRTR